MEWIRAVALLFVSAALIFHDGWTTTDAGCRRYGDGTDDSASLANALDCERLSWRGSREAALRSALIYANHGEPRATRRVLTPFEGIDDPRTLYILGWADGTLGERKLALDEIRRAYESVRKVEDVRVRANAATQYAQGLSRDGEYEESVRVLNELMHSPGAETLGLEFVRDCYLNLARALAAMGDAPAAATELERLKTRLGLVPMLARELTLEARLQFEREELQSADELAVQAQRAAGPGERPYAGEAVILRLRIALRQGDSERVHQLFSELETYNDALDVSQQRAVTEVRGLAARAEGHLEESQRFFEHALTLDPEPDQLWMLHYELGVSLRAEGHWDDAKRAFEASISEVEGQRKQLTDPGLQPALISRRQKPFDALFDLLAERGDSEGALSVLRKSLASRLTSNVVTDASNSQSTVEDALRRSEARRMLSQAHAGLPERLANAGDRNAAFVAFVAAETHAWSVVSAGGRTTLERIASPPQELCGLMQRFGADFDEGLAIRLGQLLFPPTRLARLGPRFAILLPGCARNFPLAAVRIEAGRLIDRAVVSIAPDLSTVARGEEENDETRGRSVFADPHGDLAFALEEARWIADATGADVRAGEKASEKALESLPPGELLHFATHTALGTAGPSLVLADRNLTVSAILKHRIHAQLVVLASCHSGSSSQTTVAETLATAFLRAGSGAVLATLRSLEDRVAFDVVRAFYAEGGLADPAGALAKVQRRLARSEPPSQWAVFFIAGSAEPTRSPAARLAQHTGGPG